MLQSSVRLSLRHPTINPDEITVKFGLKPYRCWRAGENRKTPKGSALPGLHKDTVWSYVILQPGERAFFKNALAILSLLEEHEAFLANFTQTGGQVSICIHLPGDTNIGDVMPWQELMRMAHLNVDLSIEVFPG